MLEERISELIDALNANTAALAAISSSAADRVRGRTIAALPTADEDSAEPAPDPAPEAEAPPRRATLAEVREALLAHKNRHDRAATLDLLKQFVPEGAQLIVGNVPAERYGDLIAAAGEA